MEAPPGLGIEVIGVPAGAPLEVTFRMESVMEGVLVTGTVQAPLQGECVRCLDPLDQQETAEFQEMFLYPEVEGYGRRPDDADDEDEGEESLFVQGDLFDLEPVLRDAVVLALPMQPVCREDCAGLCPQCGIRLDDDPDHHHDAVDIRWAALQGLVDTVKDDEKDNAARAEGSVR